MGLQMRRRRRAAARRAETSGGPAEFLPDQFSHGVSLYGRLSRPVTPRAEFQRNMLVQNRAPCRLRTTAGSGPRLWRGSGGLRRARPRKRGRAPASGPEPTFGRQAQPWLLCTVPPPSTGAPAATDLLLRQLSASASSAYGEYASGAAASASSHEAHRRRDAPSSASLRKANRTSASWNCFGQLCQRKSSARSPTGTCGRAGRGRRGRRGGGPGDGRRRGGGCRG